MYQHLDRDTEVRCMSNSLPTLFRNPNRYRRPLATTAEGIVVT